MSAEPPPGPPAGGPDAGDDPVATEARGLALLDETRGALLDGVARCLPRWVEQSVRSVLDAWGGAAPETRARAMQSAAAVGPAVAVRIGSELAALLGRDPEDQSATPLEIVRTAVREPTVILEAAGVPEVVRDEFARRASPDDRYGLVPARLGDLGDPELAALQLAWGVGKATVIRARRGGSRPR